MSILITSSQKRFIDESDYESLLRKYRFCPDDSPYLTGETYQYFINILFSMSADMEPADRAATSTKVGYPPDHYMIRGVL